MAADSEYLQPISPPLSIQDKSTATTHQQQAVFGIRSVLVFDELQQENTATFLGLGVAVIVYSGSGWGTSLIAWMRTIGLQ